PPPAGRGDNALAFTRRDFSPEPSDQSLQNPPLTNAGLFSLLPFATESKRKRNADRRWSYLRTGRCGACPVSCPSPICGGGFRGGTLACRRPTAALAKGAYVTFGATQAMLPGTRSERVLPAFSCPSPVSTSRADRSIGRHDARAG